MSQNVMDLFHPVIRTWFERRYGPPSPPQAMVWPAIKDGRNALVVSPTGSGKTLAAFLMCLNILIGKALSGEDLSGVQVVYISPLKALNNDIKRNLEEPLLEIGETARELGFDLPEIKVDVRTGDTPSNKRAAMLKRPPHILITTPESFYLLLTGPKSRDILRRTAFIIVDEIHAMCANKRGVHLALSMERLSELTPREPIRIGLSATQRPLEEVAAFLAGYDRDGNPRDVAILDAGMRKGMDLSLLSPVTDWRNLQSGDLWSGVATSILNLVENHRSVIVFTNTRQSVERLASRLNDLAGERIALCHHGSMSRDLREEAEDLLKRGKLRCLVATSTMELGIDVGFVDLVVQVESPHSVSGGLQRVGRAGHLLHAESKGRMLPKSRIDILECVAVAGLMQRGLIEETKIPKLCYDVLAQHIVAMATLEDRTEEDLLALARRTHCYREITRNDLQKVLEMLSGRTYGNPVGGVKPRIFWDKGTGVVSKVDGSRFIALRNAGTIPDRGAVGVYLGDGNLRLGELDETFVFESRVGDTFVLGSSVYRFEKMEKDRVRVSLSSSSQARMPFWNADPLGRAFHLSIEMGRLARELSAIARTDDEGAFIGAVRAKCRLDTESALGLRGLFKDQMNATEVFPDDRTFVVEHFKDEYGDTRGAIHSLFGGKVNFALSRLLSRKIAQMYLVELEYVHRDNGILYNIPKGVRVDLVAALREVLSGDVMGHLLAELPKIPTFPTLFRQNAIRALVFSRPGAGRMPLWLARLKANDALQDAVGYGGDHPLVKETLRECLEDAYDAKGLLDVARRFQAGQISIVKASHGAPSPLAMAYTFNFTSLYMYQEDKTVDAAKAEGLLKSSYHWAEEPVVISEVERELDPLNLVRQGSKDALHLAVDVAGDIPVADVLNKWGTEAEGWIDSLLEDGAAEKVFRGGTGYLVSQAASGTGEAAGVTGDPVEGLLRLMEKPSARWVPMETGSIADRFGVGRDLAREALSRMEERGLMRRLEPSAPEGDERWCHPSVAEMIGRRSLSLRRRSIVPVDILTGAKFMLLWSGTVGLQASDEPNQGYDRLMQAISQLQGTYLPPEVWEGMVFPMRVKGYQKSWLDQLCATGEVLWVAQPPEEAAEGAKNGELRVGFYLADEYSRLVNRFSSQWAGKMGDDESRVLDCLIAKGAAFTTAISRHTSFDADEVNLALKALAAKGMVSNDTFLPARSWNFSGSKGSRRGRPPGVPTGRWFAVPGPAAQEAASMIERQDNDERFLQQLFSRYGLVCREIADISGSCSFGSIEDELVREEEAGKIRRGYIVDGLAGMQFARPDALASLDASKEDPRVNDRTALIPLIDPGSLLLRHWLAKNGFMPAKISSSYVVIADGRPVLLAEGNGSKITPLGELSASDIQEAAAVLKEIGRMNTAMGKSARVEVQTWKGRPVLDDPASEALSDAGFTRGVSSMMAW